MYFVYVIENSNKKKYTGQTNDLEKRLARHNGDLPTKKTSYTSKHGASWKYIYIDEFKTREEAIIREKELKTGKGRAFLNKILSRKKN